MWDDRHISLIKLLLVLNDLGIDKAWWASHRPAIDRFMLNRQQSAARNYWATLGF